MKMEKRFADHYADLIGDFCREISLRGECMQGITAPFLPAFGDLYEQASPRVVFVGMETRGWQDVRSFLKEGRKDPDELALTRLKDFRRLDFVNWGNNFGSAFWDVILFMMAALYSLDDWKLLKRGMNEGILRSVAWGNCNAVERYTVTAEGQGADYKAWEQVKRASMRFDKLSHIIETLQPDSVVVMYRGMNRDTFFEGLDWCAAASDDPAIQHSIAAGVHVFNLPHPTGMRKRRKESFKEPLMALFHHNGLKFTRGSFLKHDAEVREFVHGLERRSAKEADKYACIELIAKQLDADGCIMSAQCLATILNDLGHLTDYGTAYKGARGTYRLIRGAYCRCERRGNMGLAAAIAKAFVKPNGTYAYG